MRHRSIVLIWAGVNAAVLWEGHQAGDFPGVGVAFVFLVAVNAALYWYADGIMLLRHDAREADEGEHPELRRQIQAMARQLDLPVPKLFIVAEPSLKAFVTGFTQERSILAVSAVLVRKMTPSEIAPVILHELSHIRKNRGGATAAVVRISRAFADLASMAIWSSSRERKEAARRLRRLNFEEQEVRCFSCGCGARI